MANHYAKIRTLMQNRSADHLTTMLVLPALCLGCPVFEPNAKVVLLQHYITYILNSQVRGHHQLDVMVFMHGGAWIAGDGATYQPNYLLDKDIVLVTFNYRLGPLGKEQHV